jgi:protein-tyrosine-phosphatase
MKQRVLFLCATNGVESPIAGALLKGLDSEHFEVTSAGIDRGETHPLTIEVMKEIGVDLEIRVTKATRDILDRGFDLVITLCDRAKLECPKFQGAEIIHWQFENPLTASDHTQQRRMFRSLRAQIAQRVRLFALVQVRFADAVRHEAALST